MVRRESGSVGRRATTQTARANLVGVDVSAPDEVLTGERTPITATVTNKALVILPSDKDSCSIGAGNGFQLTVEISVDQAPSRRSVLVKEDIDAPVLNRGGNSVTICLNNQFTSKDVVFSVAPQSSTGTVSGEITVTGANSGVEVASGEFETAVTQVDDPCPPGEVFLGGQCVPENGTGNGGGNGNNNGNNNGGGNGNNNGNNNGDKNGKGQSLAEWWESLSSTEKAIVGLGGAALTAGVLQRRR